MESTITLTSQSINDHHSDIKTWKHLGPLVEHPTNLPLILSRTPLALLSTSEARHTPSPSPAPAPLTKIATTSIDNLLLLLAALRDHQVVVRFPCPRPARRSTHSRPRRARRVAPLPLLPLETRVPVLTAARSHLSQWGGHGMPGSGGGLGRQSESEQCSAAEAKRPPLRGCCTQTSGI